MLGGTKSFNDLAMEIVAAEQTTGLLLRRRKEFVSYVSHYFLGPGLIHVGQRDMYSSLSHGPTRRAAISRDGSMQSEAVDTVYHEHDVTMLAATRPPAVDSLCAHMRGWKCSEWST